MEITVESIVFLILGAITLGGALMVVISRNLFHAGLYLMLSLFGVAGLFALLSAPFLAVVQVVVYIGAIAILIMLAIMLTPGVTVMKQILSQQWVAGLLVAILFFLMVISVVSPLMDDLGVNDWNANFTQKNAAAVPADSLNTLGEDLVDPDKYMLPFEVASLLLMAAMIGAVLVVNPGDDEQGDS